MDQIYSDAAVVLVWLGRLVGSEPRCRPEWTEEKRQKERERYRHSVELNGFMEADYWDRTWTVQEFVLAPRIHFFWLDRGGEVMDLIAEQVLEQIPKSQLASSRGGARAYLVVLYDGSSQWLGKLSLLDWMLEFYSCECLDKRDRIFALMGLIRDDERRLLSIFFPDYERDHANVVVIALSILQHLHGRPILGQQGPEGFEDAEPASESYSEEAHGSSWACAVLTVMGMSFHSEEDVAWWQAAVDHFQFTIL
ncbi:uncharacterized protein RHO25_012892 [Cercospora beticola]|uniref:Heterokaryon incompatibility domain-containing protein n=1 Tax=Cercospora beticola TaxID=122368 RepID=A0ABZ0P8I2_CERBT|nr:hypothetical protein RHO25_012892 [Cercospora beticola]CAK1367898.1 unnamed protein product [Cercospora beticola]